MLQEVIYCIAEGSQVVFNHIPHHIIVYVEIAMCDTVAHAFYSFPWNFGASRQQMTLSSLINALKALTYCLNKHTICSQSLGTFGRGKHIINLYKRCVPQLQIMD